MSNNVNKILESLHYGFDQECNNILSNMNEEELKELTDEVVKRLQLGKQSLDKIKDTGIGKELEPAMASAYKRALDLLERINALVNG